MTTLGVVLFGAIYIGLLLVVVALCKAAALGDEQARGLVEDVPASDPAPVVSIADYKRDWYPAA